MLIAVSAALVGALVGGVAAAGGAYYLQRLQVRRDTALELAGIQRLIWYPAE